MSKRDRVKLFKRGDVFWLRYSDANGKQQRTSLGISDEGAAQKARDEQEFKLKWEPGSIEQRDAAVPTLSEYVGTHEEPGLYLTWFKARYPSSYQRVESIMRTQLLPRFGRVQLNKITSVMATAFQTDRMVQKSKRPRFDGVFKRVRKGTVNKEMRQLKAVLYSAKNDHGLIKAHPWEIGSVELFKEDDSKPFVFYSVDEMQDIYEASGNHRWWWQMFVNTGMRKGEGVHLQRSDIRGARVAITSRDEIDEDGESERTKSGQTRYVDLNEEALEALDMLGKEKYVLPRLHTNSFTRAFARDLRKANVLRAKRGLKPLDGSLHCLRHTFCSHLVMNGTDVETIRDLAGHAKLETTMRYTHVTDEHKKKAVASLSFKAPKLRLVKNES